MILAATAIPVELRPLGHAHADFGIQAPDFFENVVGYLPLGIVLADMGTLWAILTAALISTGIETGQLVMMYRVPAVADVAANVIGAILGIMIAARWEIRSPAFRIGKGKALLAAMLALLLLLVAWANASPARNARGATAPGTLEAWWKFDETGGRVALDSSGHGLLGSFVNEPQRVAGVMGGAVNFDGAASYIDFDHPTALRLVGSMTVTAWIRAASFPADDAAIVSQLNDLGYQLDATADEGPRTIGFKLTDACGGFMARYGATPLALQTWYHVAGVYDAAAKTLDVYLNGQPDNGALVGSVTGAQRSSRAAVYLGRRSDQGGFEFSGAIDDVRIYSLALTQAEIAAAMHGKPVDRLAAQPTAANEPHRGAAERPVNSAEPCTGSSDREDSKVPLAAAALGLLVAIACISFRPSAGPALLLIVSFAAGFLFFPATSSTPLLWTTPLISFAGGASVAVSLRRSKDPGP